MAGGTSSTPLLETKGIFLEARCRRVQGRRCNQVLWSWKKLSSSPAFLLVHDSFCQQYAVKKMALTLSSFALAPPGCRCNCTLFPCGRCQLGDHESQQCGSRVPSPLQTHNNEMAASLL